MKEKIKQNKTKIIVFAIILLSIAIILNLVIVRTAYSELKHKELQHCTIFDLDDKIELNPGHFTFRRIVLNKENDAAFLKELKTILLKAKGVPRLGTHEKNSLDGTGYLLVFSHDRNVTFEQKRLQINKGGGTLFYGIDEFAGKFAYIKIVNEEEVFSELKELIDSYPSD